MVDATGNVYAFHPRYPGVYINVLAYLRPVTTITVSPMMHVFYANRKSVWNAWYGSRRQFAFEYFNSEDGRQ